MKIVGRAWLAEGREIIFLERIYPAKVEKRHHKPS